jgi:hypothetical protein
MIKHLIISLGIALALLTGQGSAGMASADGGGTSTNAIPPRCC